MQSLPQRDAGPLNLTAAALVLSICALWGGTPVAISYAVDTLPPVAVAALRFAMGAAFMLVWCRFDGSGYCLRAGQVKPAVIAGVLLFVQISLFNLGISLTSSSHATMLINTFVFWVVGIEHFVTRGDRLEARRVTGLLLAASGALVVFKSSTMAVAAGARDAPTLTGDAILAVSAFVLGIKIVYVKRSLRVVEPGKLILWHDLVGVALFSVYSLAVEETVRVEDFTPPVVLGLLYQGVLVAGLCFALQTHLLRRYSASRVSVFTFSTPLFGVVFAHLFRGDRLTPWIAIAAVCIAAGIFIVNLGTRADAARRVRREGD